MFTFVKSLITVLCLQWTNNNIQQHYVSYKLHTGITLCLCNKRLNQAPRLSIATKPRTVLVLLSLIGTCQNKGFRFTAFTVYFIGMRWSFICRVTIIFEKSRYVHPDFLQPLTFAALFSNYCSFKIANATAVLCAQLH